MYTRRDVLRTAAAVLAAEGFASASRGADDPAGLIIDTHQHLWDLAKFNLPWLTQSPEILRQTYHTKEYLEATHGLNMKAVYMEVFVDPAQLVAEAKHVVGLCRAGTSPTIGAVIGGRPESPQFADYIGRFQGSKHVKGVRRVLHAPETPAGYCLQPQFIENVRLLGEMRMSFDLCMRPGELGDGAKLTELCPDTRFVVDHCGNADPKAFHARLAKDEKPTHSPDDWKSGMERLAKRPNVICKISGIVARLPQEGDAADLAVIVNHCLDVFGPDRVVFGSDWPVCLLGRPLRRWVEMLSQIIRGRPAVEQQKLWSGNAVRQYSLTV
jgi:predicted TIM-barrel fold metal-dependent hydrolase